jgi:ribosomal protein L24
MAAHPEIIACVISGCAFDAVLLCSLRDAILQTIASGWLWLLYMVLLAFPAATGLGVLLGRLPLWLLLRPLCGRINGTPLRPGDLVTVLAGPRKGTVAEVREVRRVGQGGWPGAVLSLGGAYEDWLLFRTQRDEQCCFVSQDELAETHGVKLRVLNRICAHPLAIVLTLAVCVFGALVLRWLQHGAPAGLIGVQIYLCLMAVGMAGITIFIACARINGTPYKSGDQVIVISGPFEGMLTEVREVILHINAWASPIEVVVRDCGQTYGVFSLVKVREANRIDAAEGETA